MLSQAYHKYEEGVLTQHLPSMDKQLCLTSKLLPGRLEIMDNQRYS